MIARSNVKIQLDILSKKEIKLSNVRETYSNMS